MMLSTWTAAQDAVAADRAVNQLERDAFCLREAGSLNDDYTTMKYSKMAQTSTIDACKAVVKKHVTACKDEVVRRFAVGRSAEDVEQFEDMIKDIFEAHKMIETPAELEQRVQPVVARRRELIDRPNSEGEPMGSRTGDHVYDVPIADGLKAILYFAMTQACGPKYAVPQTRGRRQRPVTALTYSMTSVMVLFFKSILSLGLRLIAQMEPCGWASYCIMTR